MKENLQGEEEGAHEKGGALVGMQGELVTMDKML